MMTRSRKEPGRKDDRSPRRRDCVSKEGGREEARAVQSCLGSVGRRQEVQLRFVVACFVLIVIMSFPVNVYVTRGVRCVKVDEIAEDGMAVECIVRWSKLIYLKGILCDCFPANNSQYTQDFMVV